MAMPTARVRTAKPSPTCLGSTAPRAFGRNAVTRAPTSGSAQRTVSQGKLLMRGPHGIVCWRSEAGEARDFVGCSCEVHRQEREDDEQRAAEEGQGVGPDEAVLRAAREPG